MENNEYLEKIEYVLGNFNSVLKNTDTKIIRWWKITGLILLGLLMIIGYTFCKTSGHLVILSFVGLFLMCIWFIIDNIIKKKIITDHNFILEYKELISLKLYIVDSLITEAIEIKARGSYSRDKLQEIKELCENLKTEEGIKKAETILKALDINLSDIKWTDGSKTGIKIVE